MQDFLKFYDLMADKYGFTLNIYRYGVSDWVIRIGYTGENVSCPVETIVSVQNCDMDLAFATAQVEFKEWLLDHKGGY